MPTCSLASLIGLIVWRRCREPAYRPRSELRLLALRARPAYDKTCRFLVLSKAVKAQYKLGR